MEKSVTIYSLAKELGMTPSMVSRALNPRGNVSPEKRQLVLEAAAKYDFHLNKFASRLPMQPLKIGVLINSRSESVTKEMVTGLEKAYQHWKDYKIDYIFYSVKITDNVMETCERQLLAMADCDGVIIDGLSFPAFDELLRRFTSINPNLVQVQEINENIDYLFVSKHKERTAAHIAAELLARFLSSCNSDQKNILLFTGDMKSLLHKTAFEGFADACKEFNLNLLDSIDMMDSEEFLKRNLSKIFDKYRDKIDGIYITSGVSSELCRYLEDNRLKIPFIAFDIYEPLAEYIRKGIIYISIYQDIASQMEKAYEKLAEYLVFNKKPEKFVYTNVVPVMKSNLEQYAVI